MRRSAPQKSARAHALIVRTPIFIAFYPCRVPTWYAKCTCRDTPFSTHRCPPHPKKVIKQKVPFANYGPKQVTELLIWHPHICVFPEKKRSAVPGLTLGAVRLTSRNWQKRGPVSGLTAYIYIYPSIYIYAVVLLSGPSLGVLNVILSGPSLFFYKTPIVKKHYKIGVSAHFLKNKWRAKNLNVIIWSKLTLFKTHPTWTR